MVKNPPANPGDTGLIPDLGRPLEKEMAPHSNILAWKSPWTEWAIVHGLIKSWARLSNWHPHSKLL